MLISCFPRNKYKPTKSQRIIPRKEDKRKKRRKKRDEGKEKKKTKQNKTKEKKDSIKTIMFKVRIMI